MRLRHYLPRAATGPRRLPDVLSLSSLVPPTLRATSHDPFHPRGMRAVWATARDLTRFRPGLALALAVAAPLLAQGSSSGAPMSRADSTRVGLAPAARATGPTALPAESTQTALSRATGSDAWQAWVLGTSINVIGQSLRPFAAKYSGPLSLTASGDRQMSQAFGVYAGARLTRRLEVYIDFEMIRGDGISNASGLAGLSNGDVLRQGSTDLGKDPYLARAYLRYTVALPGATEEMVERTQGQVPGPRPSRRLEFYAGKLALNDLMDLNRYAGSTRLQFQNWGLWQNTAWDYAADTRGYSNGVALAWIEPRWVLRLASVQMPTMANGNILDAHLDGARGDNVELTASPGRWGTVVRALAYVNRGRMGRYAVALATGAAAGKAPDIVADDAEEGRIKYGYGLNVEQPLADGGETGLFARFGWDDGATESFAFTEVDRHVSVGAQFAGARWGRPADRAGIATVVHGLANVHAAYLAAGGSGFLLGDGALNYGRETVVEAYYRWQLGPYLQVSPDMQQVWNPGYNRDRGPATVVALRLYLKY